MVASTAQRLSKAMSDTALLYYRLVLVVGPARSGKTTLLRRLAAERNLPLVNVNLVLAERLLDLTSRQRALQVPRLLDQIVQEQDGDVILLDNIEILFSPEFQQDPLRLLQGLSRNRTVLAAWAGKQDGDNLTYAEPAHPEIRRYHKPDAILVATSGQKHFETTEKKESV